MTPIEEAQQFLSTLASAERLGAQAMRAYQLKLLERTVRHAREHVPAYQDRLAPLFDSWGAFDLKRWPLLPVLRRPELREGGPEFRAQDTPDALGPLLASATTGSTGLPLTVVTTRVARLVSRCFNERRYQWHGLDPKRSHALLNFQSKEKASPEGGFTNGWSLLDETGPFHTFSTVYPIEDQLRWLERIRPAYLSVYPSVAAEIATTFADRAKDLGVEAILTYGELLDPNDRRTIGETFGARVIDTYSANEVGFVAVDCPSGAGYHVMAEGIFVEVLGPDGSPVRPGEPGEVVVTPFYNTVMPLVRYAIGDFAVPEEGPCPCGRPHPRLRSVVGRSRQIFHFVDGSAKWPNIHVGDLQACVALRQFQVIQRGLSEIELRYVPRPGERRVDLDALTALARRDLHPSVTITATEIPEIPRGPGGKFEQYVSRIGAGAAPA